MSKISGNIAASAAESERTDDDKKEQEAAAAAPAAAAPPQSYPSLKEDVNTNKVKKKTKMSLQKFLVAGSGGIGGGGSRRDSAFEHQGSTHDEMMRLPTGPKERSAEEIQYGRLGGGFSSYGSGRSGGGPRTRDGDSSWGNNRRSYGGFNDYRRGPPSRDRKYDQPSRADEVDSWATTKKPMTPSFDATSRPNRYSSLGGGGGVSAGGGGFSRATDSDNWAMDKKPAATPVRSSNVGSGVHDSGGPEPDRWSRGGVMPHNGNQERRRLVLDPPKVERLSTQQKPLDSRIGSAQSGMSAEASASLPGSEKPKPKVNPFGDAKPRELVLQGISFDNRNVGLNSEQTRLGSRTGSAQSGRSAEGSGSLPGSEKPKPKVNPFGDARPREVVLQERALDLEQKRLDRSSERPQSRDDKRGIPSRKDGGFLGNRDLGSTSSGSSPKDATGGLPPSDAIGRLPIDLTRKVLTHTLAKEAARSRCVSKEWNNFLSESRFIASHLQQSLNSTGLTLLHHSCIIPEPQFVFLLVDPRHELTVNEPIRFPENPEPLLNNFKVIGAVDGLICSSYGDSLIQIWNPSRKLLFTLPPFHEVVDTGSASTYLRFGFQPRGSDYKVVKLVGVLDGSSIGSWMDVEIYSMRTNSWERINERFPAHISEIFDTAVLCSDTHGGNVHWLCGTAARSYPILVVGCDLSSKSFHEMALPYQLCDLSLFTAIGVLESKLCLMSWEFGGVCEVWVMEKYMDVQSWVKKYVLSEFVGINIQDRTYPFGFTTSGLLLCRDYRGFLFVYDPVAGVRSGPVVAYRGNETNEHVYNENKIVEYVDSLVWVP